jgi:D-glycero-alpha-D-manno-heptose-7-phosphate kinase
MTDSTVRATAPLRISFVGGGTDFPHYYEEHGGAVVSATIDRCARVDVTARRERRVTIRSLDLGHRSEYHLERRPVFDGLLDLPKAAIARVGTRSGIDIDITSDAPPGSGLGGSSALVAACVGALAALEDRSMTAFEVANVSYAIEREDLGIAGGWQDQYAAAVGGFNLLEFSRGKVNVTPLALPPEALEEIQRHLLLCYTGHVRTDLGLIDTQIRMYEEGREETMIGMKQLHELAYEMRHAIESVDLRSLGGLLHEAYESKRRMNPRIVEGTPIDGLLALAREAGATGGKICGAGGGGYLLVACEPDRQAPVRAALESRGVRVEPFSFRGDGVEARRGDRRWRPA